MTIKVDLQNALEHDSIDFRLPKVSELERWLNVAVEVLRFEKAQSETPESVGLEKITESKISASDDNENEDINSVVSQTIEKERHINRVQTEAFEITLRFVDELESQQLNNDYRQKNKPTNVLSFEFEAPEHIQMSFLGDLVICAAVVEQEAKEQQKKPIEHLTHLCIHGLLHLLGYDHINENDAEEMETLETNILAKLNINDPYRDRLVQSYKEIK